MRRPIWSLSVCLALALGLVALPGCPSSGDCTPATCASMEYECGTWPDGCGETLECGSCATGETCDSMGQCQASCTPQCTGRCCGDNGCGGTCPDHCAATGQTCDVGTCTCSGTCQPQDCAQLQKECGTWPDGCGETLECGGCPTGETCDANGQCQITCQPADCGTLGKECGSWDDGCGGMVNCGTCGNNETCDADGQCQSGCQPSCAGLCCGGDGCGGTCPDHCAETNQVCNTQTCTCQGACTPLTCTQLQKECGSWDDGCGGQVNCGACGNNETCDANGQCQVTCQPADCGTLGKECGSWDDGCGGQVNCGVCEGNTQCNAMGLCQPVCVPTDCAAAGVDCGPLNDGCGNVLDCGGCPNGQTCSQGQCVSGAPVLSLLSQNGGTFTLRWTFVWPGIVSTSDHHVLEESTTSSTGGFVQILETTWNDHHMPWDETLSRQSGTYYYRVRTLSNSNWSPYSNVITVQVNQQPATLLVVNDLTAQTIDGVNWGNLNQVIRLYLAGDYDALCNCDDSCDLLWPPEGCSLPGLTIEAGGDQQSFDVSMHTDGSYCLFIQNGWWDYFCTEFGCCWEEHLSEVINCAGNGLIPKWFWVCYDGHYSGVTTLYLSQWLPQTNFYGSGFCK